MTQCVESFIGAGDGGKGVTLEQQVMITGTGVLRLLPFPFEDAPPG